MKRNALKRNALGQIMPYATEEERKIKHRESQRKSNKKYFATKKGREREIQAYVRTYAKKTGRPIPPLTYPDPERFALSAVLKRNLKKTGI